MDVEAQDDGKMAKIMVCCTSEQLFESRAEAYRILAIRWLQRCQSRYQDRGDS